MSPRVRAVDPARLARWCLEHLGSPPADEIFRSGYLSAVVGLRLADDREVVVKVRPDSPRIAACVEVQRRMFLAGYPCPQPLTAALPFGGGVATAEAYVPGGAMLPSADHAARAFAEAFARLIRLTPRPAEVSALDPAPSWAAWNHAGDGLWPCPEDPDVNLNEVAGPEWIDDTGRRARDRLRASESEAVIGHCDWLAGNLRWSGDALLVVHDWDSMTADSEAVLVGFAAALYSTVSADELATVEDTERFLVAYCHARGREFSADDIQFLPRPVQQPGVPVWAAAFTANRKPLRRAARCDGLFPANVDHPDQLAAAVATITALRGPASGPYDIAVGLPIGVDPAPFAKAGATWWLRGFPPGVSLDVVRGVLRDGPAQP